MRRDRTDGAVVRIVLFSSGIVIVGNIDERIDRLLVIAELRLVASGGNVTNVQQTLRERHSVISSANRRFGENPIDKIATKDGSMVGVEESLAVAHSEARAVSAHGAHQIAEILNGIHLCVPQFFAAAPL
jgi:hypothetical protein